MSSAMILGSDAHLPRQIRLPARRIETDVSFIARRDRYILLWLFFIRCLGPASSREPVFPSYRGTATGFHPLSVGTASGATRSRDYPMWTAPTLRHRSAIGWLRESKPH